ncbi:VOC family protein [Bacillus pinisoli]|uniref:VOC family protein n=1 Tax=Bacillus pinisoli TaxID=2901866 RepID=UPI00300E085D
MFCLKYIFEDIERDYNQLSAKGVKLLFDEPKPCSPGRYLIIKDPIGNKIEL